MKASLAGIIEGILFFLSTLSKIENLDEFFASII